MVYLTFVEFKLVFELRFQELLLDLLRSVIIQQLCNQGQVRQHQQEEYRDKCTSFTQVAKCDMIDDSLMFLPSLF